MIVSKAANKAVKGFVPHSDRMCLLQLHIRLTNINTIPVGISTTDKKNVVIEGFYDQVRHVMKMTNKQDINVMMGDINAKVGRRKRDQTVRDFRFDTQNERTN